MRLFDSLTTGLNGARALFSRGVGGRWRRRGGNLKADEMAEEGWLHEDAAAGDGQFLGSHAKGPPPPRGVAPDFERAAMDSVEDARNDSRGVLAIHHLAKAYKARRVVEDVSLHVRRGEAVGLLGPNGAGKTTVFYMITGLVKPDKGTISLDGYDVTPLPMYRRARLGVGYLPQEASVFRGLSVEDNIRAVLEITQPDARQRAEELEGLLDEFKLTRLRKTPAVALSGGERRRCKSPARWPVIPPSCCSTSPSPASTPSRSAAFRIWCVI